MPYLETAQSWLTQSNLLLQARPCTTRITTKYTIAAPNDPSAPSKSKPRKQKPTTTNNETPSNPATPTPDPIRATLTLKTYDPASGTTLKYSTTKAAEVSRLIQILGRLARPMAGLPGVKEDVPMVDAVAADVGSGVATPVVEMAPAVAGKGAPTGGQGGAGGKRGKKKGKK